MRLPASVTTQPPEPINAPQPAATYVDPTEVADVPQAQVEHKPWWVRASSAIVNGAFTNVAAAFIAVTGAIYVGMAHAPWVRSLAGHTPTAEQASDAMSVAMAATPASAATPQAAQPDPVEAARDRMEQRVYSQASPAPRIPSLRRNLPTTLTATAPSRARRAATIAARDTSRIAGRPVRGMRTGTRAR